MFELLLSRPQFPFVQPSVTGHAHSFLASLIKAIFLIPNPSLSVWCEKKKHFLLLVYTWLILSEKGPSWVTSIFIANCLLLSCRRTLKSSDSGLNGCSCSIWGNLILTLCFAAISWPCSVLTFLRCTRSTLFATNTIGKASLRGNHTQRPEQHIFNSHPEG